MKKTFSQKYKQSYLIFFAFTSVVLIILALHFWLHPVRVLGMDTSIFYLDEKYTLATFFTSATSFLVGFLSFTNTFFTQAKLRQKIVDIGFGLFFIILSIDEFFEIHEYLNTIIKLRGDNLLSRLANFSWVFSLSFIILIIFTLFTIKILTKSGSKAKKPFIFGGLSFAAVLFFELVGSVTYGNNIYLYFVAAEEGLEMIGVSFFLLGVLLENQSKSN